MAGSMVLAAAPAAARLTCSVQPSGPVSMLINSELKPLGEKVEGQRDLLPRRNQASLPNHGRQYGRGWQLLLQQRDCRVLCKDCLSTVNCKPFVEITEGLRTSFGRNRSRQRNVDGNVVWQAASGMADSMVWVWSMQRVWVWVWVWQVWVWVWQAWVWNAAGFVVCRKCLSTAT